MKIQTINPATEKVIKSYELMNDQKLNVMIEQSHTAFLQLQAMTIKERASCLSQVEHLLLKNKNHYAQIISEEMGKPIKQSASEVEKCAWVVKYYVEHAEEFLKEQRINLDKSTDGVISFEPLGAVFAIMPWNFPFWQVFRFAAPALLAGNAGILKHALNVSECSLTIEEIFSESGLPQHAFCSLIISDEQTTQVISHPYVAAVTLTGSTRAGRSVAEKSGKALKKMVLELGGNDPYLILADADIDLAAQSCVASRLINSGQSCIAAKRFIAVQDVIDQFTELVVNLMKSKKFGSPFDETNDLGPLARKDLQLNLHQQVETSCKKGAKLLCGGFLPDSKGFYYPPTVLSNVKKGMPAYDEELFGPACAIIAARDEHHAIELANDSIYGLGAAIFSKDLKHAEHIAKYQLQAGGCAINTFVKSDPRLPFGGIKQSGYGRELGVFGMHEFINIKSVMISSP